MIHAASGADVSTGSNGEVKGCGLTGKGSETPSLLIDNSLAARIAVRYPCLMQLNMSKAVDFDERRSKDTIASGCSPGSGRVTGEAFEVPFANNIDTNVG